MDAGARAREIVERMYAEGWGSAYDGRDEWTDAIAQALAAAVAEERARWMAWLQSDEVARRTEDEAESNGYASAVRDFLAALRAPEGEKG